MGGRFGAVQAVPVFETPGSESGVGHVGGPAASAGVATAIARSVQQIPFDDSIDGTYPLECFFQMPERVVQINDIKIWVQRKPFRRYVSAVSGSSNNAGSNQTSQGGGGTTATSTSGGGGGGTSSENTHSHGLTTAGSSTGGSGTLGTSSPAGTTDNQGLHNHSDPQGGFTGDAGVHGHNVTAHSHTVSDHGHGYTLPNGTTNSGLHSHTFSFGGHTHDVTLTNHTHTVDTTHSHTITTTLTAGIFEEALSGTVSLYVSDTGLAANYVGPVVSGQTEINGLSIRTYLTKTKGDKRIRINGTALMRVQVLVFMDLILELGV